MTKPMTFLTKEYPVLAAKAGPRKFLGWMHREAFPNAPDDPNYDGGGTLVLYAPKELFPETPTLGDMRRNLKPEPQGVARADDMIVQGAMLDGVDLERETFDPHAWAVIPDFEWPRIEHEEPRH